MNKGGRAKLFLVRIPISRCPRLTNLPAPKANIPSTTWPCSHASHLCHVYPIAIGESIVSV